MCKDDERRPGLLFSREIQEDLVTSPRLAQLPSPFQVASLIFGFSFFFHSSSSVSLLGSWQDARYFLLCPSLLCLSFLSSFFPSCFLSLLPVSLPSPPFRLPFLSSDSRVCPLVSWAHLSSCEKKDPWLKQDVFVYWISLFFSCFFW